jgi:hypothetical protein
MTKSIILVNPKSYTDLAGNKLRYKYKSGYSVPLRIVLDLYTLYGMCHVFVKGKYKGAFDLKDFVKESKNKC